MREVLIAHIINRSYTLTLKSYSYYLSILLTMDPSLLKKEATTNPLPKQPYHASCHCQKIRLKISLPPLESLTINTCNCSICTKNGYLVAYPLEEDVVFVSGSEGQMEEYRFGEKRKPHRFCPRCGTSVLVGFGESGFVEERGLVAVNVGVLHSRRENRS